MNLRSVDLNLLVVLDALLDEGHVGRAADRVGLSQPAASAALARCRHLFGDMLLERGRGAMRRTAKADALRAPLKALLAGAAALIDPPEIPIEETEATVRITMADLPTTLAIGPLLAELARSAPRIDLVVQPWHGLEGARRALIEGSSDIAVSVFGPNEDHLHCERLRGETFAVAMRADHPAAAGFDLERWLAFPHVVLSGRGETRTFLDRDLEAMGLRRRVGLVVPVFGMVPPILRTTSLLALLPERVVKLSGEGLATFPPPIPVEDIALTLAWHRRRTRDPVLRHVADRLAAILR